MHKECFSSYLLYIYIFITNKTQLQTPTDCFTPWGDHQGDLNKHNKTLKVCRGLQLCFVYNRYCSKSFDELLIEHFTKHVDFFNFCIYIYKFVRFYKEIFDKDNFDKF